MIQTPYIAVVPARAGSKGLPGKNRLEVGGKSLTLRAIESGIDSSLVEFVVLTTDDEQLFSLEDLEKVILHKRPAELASSSATANQLVEALIEFIDEETKNAYTDYQIVYLQPTSPLRTKDHVREAIELHKMIPSRALISGYEVKEPPYKWFTLDSENTVEPLFDNELSTANRQSFKPVYAPNGAIYIFSRSAFLASKQIPISGAVFLKMSKAESADVDTPEDFRKIEHLQNSK